VSQPFLFPTPDGLFCPSGNFHIDPWKPVARAVVTHAHSDHACPGCETYLCARSGASILRVRTGAAIAAITPLDFNTPITLGDTRVSLHPAGHILGSAQVRVERTGPPRSPTSGEVWVVSGDYKTIADRTCESFEPVRCHVFITESTFGLPVYRWRDQLSIFKDINAWWLENQAQQRTSILFAYALGKAQRVLGGIDPSIGPIVSHGAVARLNRAYHDAGIHLPDAPLQTESSHDVRGRGLVIAPPSAAGSPWLRSFAKGQASGGLSAGFVSGWMQLRGTRRRRAVDRGFPLSDHADWDGLLTTIRETGAHRIGVTHGYVQPLVRYLRENMGLDAFAVPTRFQGEINESAPSAEDDPLSPEDAS